MAPLIPYLLPLLSLPLALAAPTAETNGACRAIKAAIKGTTEMPGSTEYNKENRDYYNIGLAEMKPACITFPTSPEDVSAIVKILNKNPGVKFAIKSGGHDPNPGHSSTKDGVLIALRKISGVELDKTKKLAYVKPGGHWWDVIPALDKQGYTMVSGRLGVVGIGGYLMQGGVSFLSGQYGLGADNIVEWETVVANGSIINIRASERPDLAVALRGGGDQYGIVTKFTVRAYPMKQAWGGIRLYTGDRNKILAALHDFIPRMNQDPKAAIIFTGGIGLPDMSSISGMLGGSGKGSGAPGSNAAGSSPSAASILGAMGLGTTKGAAKDGNNSPMGNLMGMLSGSPLAAMLPSGTTAGTTPAKPATPAKGRGKKSVVKGLFGRNVAASHVTADPAAVFGNNTVAAAAAAEGPWEAFGIFFCYDGPNPPKGAFGKFEELTPTYDMVKTQSYSDIVGLTNGIWPYFSNRASFRSITLPYRADNPEYYAQIQEKWAKISKKYGASSGTTIAFQPFPAAIGKASEERGGNAMGLTGNDHDRFILEVAGIYNKPEEDDKVQQMGKEFTDELYAELEEASTKDTTVGRYNPLFSNDAGPDQDVMGSLKGYEGFAKLQRELDPKGLFAKRAGGFKYRINSVA